MTQVRTVDMNYLVGLTFVNIKKITVLSTRKKTTFSSGSCEEE